jgi:hypothetical protein
LPTASSRHQCPGRRSLLFEFERQFLAARFHDAALGQHVHEIGHDVVQQALVVGHHDHGALGRAHGVDAGGHGAQGVDIQAGIGLIENGQRGSSTAIWKISLRFFSPPEKPALTGRFSSVWSIFMSFILSRTS